MAPEEVRALGDGEDQLPLAEAARLVGVTSRYMRGVARYHDEYGTEIAQASLPGVSPGGRSWSLTVAPRTSRS